MTLHTRKPALIALAISSLLAAGVMAATGQFHNTDLTHKSIDELEKMIVVSKDPDVWSAYGDKLRENGRFDVAAVAYRKALDFRADQAPDENRALKAQANARVGIALALAQGNNKDAFFAYFQNLYTNYPKMAVDLIGRGELARITKDSRWEGAAEAAKAQAVD